MNKWSKLLLAAGLLTMTACGKQAEPAAATPEASVPPAVTAVAVTTPSPEPTPEPFFEWSTEEFLQYEAINPDYIGHIRFESGLIDLPVVQGATNNTYLRTDWETGAHDEEGSIFMEASDVLYGNEAVHESMNLILYGHYCYPFIDPSQTRKFTPLHQLKDQANYEENKYIDLLLKEEVRRYMIAEVFYCPMTWDDYYHDYVYAPADMTYLYTDYDQDYIDIYRNAIRLAHFYSTDVSFDAGDHLLTLQTCVENHDELRLIVVAKEVERVPLN